MVHSSALRKKNGGGRISERAYVIADHIINYIPFRFYILFVFTVTLESVDFIVEIAV